MPDDEVLRSPDSLLRHAAAEDARVARVLLARVSSTRLLDLVVTQAELAVDEDQPRRAGIDAVGDLARTAIEVMGLPQGVDLEVDLEFERPEDPGADDPDDPLDDPLDDALDDALAPPTVTGWELVSVEPDELLTATLGLAVRPWMLALVAFRDDRPVTGGIERRVVGAAADGRVVNARLRFSGLDDDADVLSATVTRDADDLGQDAALARSLLASLASAARGDAETVR